MRQRNHCSSLKGIPKMKLQGSGPSAPKSLQSQNRPRPENRLSISRLDVVHGQLIYLLTDRGSRLAGIAILARSPMAMLRHRVAAGPQAPPPAKGDKQRANTGASLAG